jgi:hypothetical protein
MPYTESELIEIFDERAAIREFDGGLSRSQAEVEAYKDWRKIVGRSVPAPQQIQEVVTKARKA